MAMAEQTKSASPSIEEMRKQVAEHDEKVANEATKYGEQALKPAIDLCEKHKFAELETAIEAARIEVAAYSQVSSLLDGIKRSLSVLPASIERAKAEAAAQYRNQQESQS